MVDDNRMPDPDSRTTGNDPVDPNEQSHRDDDRDDADRARETRPIQLPAENDEDDADGDEDADVNEPRPDQN